MGPEISKRGDKFHFSRFAYSRLGNDIPSTSNFVYRNPGSIYTPVLNTPSFTTFRPVTSTQRVSFVEPGPRPMGSGVMYGSSGHPATRVPIRPPPTSSLHTPLTTTGFRPSGAMGALMRGKTRPSHFQKWVKKYNGSGDPYGHLASF